MNKIKHYMIPEHINELFKNEAVSSISLTREMGEKLNEVIDMVNEYKTLRDNKYQEQDGKIEKAIIYLKHNLKNTMSDLIEIMKNNGEFNEIVNDFFANETFTKDIETLKNKVKDVKDFGAKGDGVTDDTQAFIKAYNYALNNNSKLTSVKIPAGRYVISSTIKIPPYIKTFIEGNVVIISKVKDGATLHYTSLNESIKTEDLKYIANNSFVDGAIIDGGNLIIQRENNVDDINSTNDSIGLLIGDDNADSTKIPVSRCSFNNITITGFKKALVIRPVNTYLLTFNHLHTENDYYGVYIGGQTKVNSGENITFNNSIFSHHYHAIYNDYEYMCGLNFNECSFDFNANHILQNKEGNVLYNFNGCHFEGVGFTDSVIKANYVNTPGFSTIIHRNNANKYSKALFILDNCFIHLNSFTSGNHLFTALNSGGKHSFVRLKDYGISWDNSKLSFDNRYMADSNTEIELSAPKIALDFIPYMGSNNDKLGKFGHISNSLSGDYSNSTFKETFDKTGYTIDANTWSSNSVNVSINTANKVFDKSIVVEQNAFNGYCSLIKEINNLSKGYIANTCYLQVGNITLKDTTINKYDEVAEVIYRFYDKNDNLIEEQTISSVDYHYRKDEWICHSTIRKVPVNAVKCKVYSTIRVKYNNTALEYKGSILYGGIITELMD